MRSGDVPTSLAAFPRAWAALSKPCSRMCHNLMYRSGVWHAWVCRAGLSLLPAQQWLSPPRCTVTVLSALWDTGTRCSLPCPRPAWNSPGKRRGWGVRCCREAAGDDARARAWLLGQEQLCRGWRGAAAPKSHESWKEGISRAGVKREVHSNWKWGEKSQSSHSESPLATPHCSPGEHCLY